MAKEKREARKKPKEHKELDIMTPFNYLDLGSNNDPCFGKHYSIKAKECSRCGDCEACAVVTSQKSFINEIAQQNNKSEFLDIQEGELVNKQNAQILEYLLKKVKSNKTKWFSILKVSQRFWKKFNLLESDEAYVTQRVIKEAKDNKLIILNKSLTKYKHGE